MEATASGVSAPGTRAAPGALHPASHPLLLPTSRPLSAARQLQQLRPTPRVPLLTPSPGAHRRPAAATRRDPVLIARPGSHPRRLTDVSPAHSGAARSTPGRGRAGRSGLLGLLLGPWARRRASRNRVTSRGPFFPAPQVGSALIPATAPSAEGVRGAPPKGHEVSPAAASLETLKAWTAFRVGRCGPARTGLTWSPTRRRESRAPAAPSGLLCSSAPTRVARAALPAAPGGPTLLCSRVAFQNVRVEVLNAVVWSPGNFPTNIYSV